MEYINDLDKLVDAICAGKSVVSAPSKGWTMVNPEWLDKGDDSQVRFDTDELARAVESGELLERLDKAGFTGHLVIDDCAPFGLAGSRPYTSALDNMSKNLSGKEYGFSIEVNDYNFRREFTADYSYAMVDRQERFANGQYTRAPYYGEDGTFLTEVKAAARVGDLDYIVFMRDDISKHIETANAQDKVVLTTMQQKMNEIVEASPETAKMLKFYDESMTNALQGKPIVFRERSEMDAIMRPQFFFGLEEYAKQGKTIPEIELRTETRDEALEAGRLHLNGGAVRDKFERSLVRLDEENCRKTVGLPLIAIAVDEEYRDRGEYTVYDPPKTVIYDVNERCKCGISSPGRAPENNTQVKTQAKAQDKTQDKTQDNTQAEATSRKPKTPKRSRHK